MFCQNCGNKNDDSDIYCKCCGKQLTMSVYNNPYANTYDNSAYGGNIYNQYSNGNMKQRNVGLGVAALTLGCLGLLAWLLPIIGFPIGIAGLICGICGISRSDKKMSKVGIVLAIICLVLTLINSVIGAYMGATGQLWFQKGNDQKVNEETYELTLRDSDGNILMRNGIKLAEAQVDDVTGDYIVYVEFDEVATETFASITEQYMGESVSIYLNDELIMNPIVNAPIMDGKCVISTNGTYEETQVLAEKLSRCK